MMLYQVLLAFAFASSFTVFGCPPTVGDTIIQNPTFSFRFSPPIRWTWNQNTTTYYPGQATTQLEMQRNINSSINNAIYTSANKLGYSTIGMTWSNNGYNPQAIVIVEDSIATTAAYVGTYVPALGSAAQKRTVFGPAPATTFQKEDYIESMSIAVKGPSSYFKSQWQALADQVFNYLTYNEKVRFQSGITIA